MIYFVEITNFSTCLIAQARGVGACHLDSAKLCSSMRGPTASSVQEASTSTPIPPSGMRTPTLGDLPKLRGGSSIQDWTSARDALTPFAPV